MVADPGRPGGGERDVVLTVRVRVHGSATAAEVAAAMPRGWEISDYAEADLVAAEVADPGTGVPRPAGTIRVERSGEGPPVITIDGQPFPWLTEPAGLAVGWVMGEAGSLAVTVTIPAAAVEVAEPKGGRGAQPG